MKMSEQARDAHRDTYHHLDYELMSLRANLRAAFSLLESTPGYGEADCPEGERLSDIGFAFLDADKRITQIRDQLGDMSK